MVLTSGSTIKWLKQTGQFRARVRVYLVQVPEGVLVQKGDQDDGGVPVTLTTVLVQKGDQDPGAERLPLKSYNRRRTKEDIAATHSLAVSLQEYTSKTWTDRFKQKPTWGKKDRVALEEFLKTHSEVTTEEFQGRWQRYLEDPDSFLKKLGYSLWYFVSKFDSYIGALRPDAPHLIFDGQEHARHRAPVPD
jgi:hypothetical protein